MTWTQIYLGCFLLGFLLSAVSWLFGVRCPPLPHVPGQGGGQGHGVHGAHLGHAAHGPDIAHGAHGDAGPGFFNFSTATAFLAWFGGAGYLLSRYSGVWPLAGLLLALIVGVARAGGVFTSMAKVLYSPAENPDPDDYDLVGQLGVVSTPIRAGGTGEILFT